MSSAFTPLRAAAQPRSWLPAALSNVELPPALAAAVSSAAPTLAGALFGGAWFVWLDAVLTSHTKVTSFCAAPGALASLALTMAATVRRSDLDGPVFDDGSASWARGWLFATYIVAYGAAGLAVFWLVSHGGWLGAAPVIQVGALLAAALALFVSGGDDGGGYSAF